MEDDVGLNFDFEGGLDAVTAASGQAPPPQAAAVAVHYAAGQGMASAPRGGQMRRSFRQTVCRHWLRGLCMKGNDCGFLHQYDKSRMPLCRFFARFGECREPDCIYKHSTEDIKECNMYKLGFCPNGPDCRYRHEKLPGPPPPLEQHLAKLQQRYQPNHQQRQQQAANHLQPEAAPRPPMGMQGPESMGTPQHSGNGPARPQKMMSASSPLPYGYSRYFVVKSSNRENLELSVQRGVWATHRNNEAKLNEALDSCDHVILIFSVNETRHFQGCAKMLSKAGYAAGAAGWKGTAHYGRNFCLKWLKLCELSFNKTRHLRNPYNENLPVKISRDCQELEATVGEQLAQLLYLEPDSELMAAANEAEGKREAQGGATTTTDETSIVPFEENEEEVEEDESDEESQSASMSHGRGMARGQHWKAGRGMRGRGMGYPHGTDFGMEGYGIPGDMFGVPPGHGFPPYFPPGPAFGNPGMGMGYGPMDGSGFHGRPPNGMLPMVAPGSMGPPRPYGMPFRPPYPGAASAEKGGRGGKMPQKRRGPRGDGMPSDSGGDRPKDGDQERSSGSGFHAKQDEYDYKANYREESESEDEAPRRSRHGEGKKKRRELGDAEDQAPKPYNS